MHILLYKMLIFQNIPYIKMGTCLCTNMPQSCFIIHMILYKAEKTTTHVFVRT